MKIYIVGSLRNPNIPEIAEALRFHLPGAEVFDDWFAAGPNADDHWKDYEKSRGHTFEQALQGYAAKNVFNFDKRHIDSSDIVLLVLPAGKSGHLELGYAAGLGKKTAIFLDDQPDRFDCMYQFASKVTGSFADLTYWLRKTIIELKHLDQLARPHNAGYDVMVASAASNDTSGGSAP